MGFVQPSTVDVEELRKFLQGRADPIVIPDIIFAMDSFPLNINSKMDRLALQASWARSWAKMMIPTKALLFSRQTVSRLMMRCVWPFPGVCTTGSGIWTRARLSRDWEDTRWRLFKFQIF